MKSTSAHVLSLVATLLGTGIPNTDAQTFCQVPVYNGHTVEEGDLDIINGACSGSEEEAGLNDLNKELVKAKSNAIVFCTDDYYGNWQNSQLSTNNMMKCSEVKSALEKTLKNQQASVPSIVCERTRGEFKAFVAECNDGDASWSEEKCVKFAMAAISFESNQDCETVLNAFENLPLLQDASFSARCATGYCGNEGHDSGMDGGRYNLQAGRPERECPVIEVTSGCDAFSVALSAELAPAIEARRYQIFYAATVPIAAIAFGGFMYTSGNPFGVLHKSNFLYAFLATLRVFDVASDYGMYFISLDSHMYKNYYDPDNASILRGVCLASTIFGTLFLAYDLSALRARAAHWFGESESETYDSKTAAQIMIGIVVFEDVPQLAVVIMHTMAVLGYVDESGNSPNVDPVSITCFVLSLISTIANIVTAINLRYKCCNSLKEN